MSCAHIWSRCHERRSGRLNTRAASGASQTRWRRFQPDAHPLCSGAVALQAVDISGAWGVHAERRVAVRPVVRRTTPSDSRCRFPGFWISTDDGMQFDSDSVNVIEIRKEANYNGLRVKFIGTCGKARCPIQLDVGYGDAVIPEPEEADYPTLLDDLPGPRLRVY